MASQSSPQSPRTLQDALELHEAGKIDAAIAVAEAVLAADPQNVEALQYLGSTLITRKKDFARGLDYLERARSLAPDDPVILYTLGWCYEYVAHELSRGRGRWKTGPVPPLDEFYAKAIAALRRAIALQPDPGLRDDAVKLLEAILGEDVDVEAIIAEEG